MGSRLKRSLKVLSLRAQGALICYRIKATILGTDPAVWREFQIDGDFELGAFHVFLQEIFGWQDEQLHAFTIQGKKYMDVVQSRRVDGEIWNEEIAMCFLNLQKGQTLNYEYECGDGWNVELQITDIIKLAERDDYEMVLDGGGASPPEGCGGRHGYADLISAYQDKSHHRHREALALFGAKFDPAVWKDKERQMAMA